MTVSYCSIQKLTDPKMWVDRSLFIKKSLGKGEKGREEIALQM